MTPKTTAPGGPKRLAPALAGNLRSVGLANLLQLLGQGQHTGCLVVDDGVIEKCFCFERGTIVGSASNDRREQLGRYLLRERLVSPQALAAAITQNPTSALGKTLLEWGLLAEPQLALMLRRKTEESLAELLRWPDARFRFWRDQLPDAAARVPFAVEVTGVLLEAMRLCDDWRRGIDTLSFRAEARDPAFPPARLVRPSSRRRPTALVGGLLSVLVPIVVGIVLVTWWRPATGNAETAPDDLALAPPTLPVASALSPAFELQVAPVPTPPEVAEPMPPAPTPIPATPTPRAKAAAAEARPTATPAQPTDALRNTTALPVRPAQTPESVAAPSLTIAETPPTHEPPDPAPVRAGSEPASAPSGASDDNVTTPRLLAKPVPRYPELALRQRKSAAVDLRVHVGADGRVLAAEPVGSDPGSHFVAAAIAAVKASRWQAGARSGAAVDMWVPLRIDFRP